MPAQGPERGDRVGDQPIRDGRIGEVGVDEDDPRAPRPEVRGDALRLLGGARIRPVGVVRAGVGQREVPAVVGQPRRDPRRDAHLLARARDERRRAHPSGACTHAPPAS